MHKSLTVVLLAGLTAPVLAQEPKAARPEPTLKVGDPAPVLKAARWLQGTEVTTFEPGKVYVVEFWAVWCGPCISAMPHLAQLQADFKDKGVTFIGYSAKDPNNSAEQVAAFVAHRGPRLKYTFAYADDKETYDTWMKAAGRNGIPCSFVVGKDAKLAYIGHPIYLDSVIPKVVDGSWNSKEGMAEVQRVTKELMGLNRVVAGKDPEVCLKAIGEFEAKNPGMAHAGYFAGQKLEALVKLKKTTEAKKVAEGVLAEASKWGDVLRLRAVSATLRTDAADDKDLLALAVRAAEGMLVAAGDKDSLALLNLATTYHAAGEKVKANEYADKAVEAASKESAAVKRHVEQAAKKLKDEGN